LQNKGYPTEFIDEVKQKCNIVSVISRHLTLEKKGKTYWACCPFHYEKTPSFAVNENEQYYHCFGCGESGDVVKFIEKYENLTFAEAVKHLAESANMKLPELSLETKDFAQLKLKSDVLNALALAKDYYVSNLKNAQIANEYIKKRQLRDDVVEYFNIGYSFDWNGLVLFLKKNNVSLEVMKQAGLIEYTESKNPYDFFAKRLTFPVLNQFGDCIGFTARTLEQNPQFAKYKNSSQTIVFDKSKTIYNINTIKNLRKEQPINYIIICEGTVDVISLYQFGFKNAVACLGTALTQFHASTLKKYTDKILLCLDGDSAGQNAMYKAINVLIDEGLEVKVVKLSESLDPDEYLKKYGKDNFQKCLDNALDAIEYKLESLSTKFDLNDSYQKNKYINGAFEIIRNLEGNSQKEIYLKLISKKTNISIDILRRDLLSDKTTHSVDEQKSDETHISQRELPVREQAHLKAVKFILASIVHKKDYALKEINKNLQFKNPNYQKLFDYVSNCLRENKPYTISSLFDEFNVDENEDIKEIINYNFNNFVGDEKVYFNECLDKIILLKLNQRQEELLSQFKNEKDLNKRREIALELQKLTKEIKLKTRE